MKLLPETLEALRRYSWPGNVRELQNSIEHAATLATGTELRVCNLPRDVQGNGAEVHDVELESASFFEEKDRLVAGFEREYLVTLLAENQFNISAAAKAAGCHRRTLYRMIQRYRIDLTAIQQERRAMRRNSDPSRQSTAGHE